VAALSLLSPEPVAVAEFPILRSRAPVPAAGDPLP
jgi:hypothetical protein